MQIYESGQVGLGNVVDVSLSAIGFAPYIGPAIGFVYLGSDYLWYQYSGITIRDNLNGINLIRF